MFAGEPVVVGFYEGVGLFGAIDVDGVVFDVFDCAVHVGGCVEEDFVAGAAPDGVVFANR